MQRSEAGSRMPKAVVARPGKTGGSVAKEAKEMNGETMAQTR